MIESGAARGMSDKNLLSDGKENNKIEDRVMRLSEAVSQRHHCEVIAVEYQKEGAQWVLRIYLDREIPVDHELCQVFSEDISEELDEDDFIKTEYLLEVSSPGIERPLRREQDFIRFIGQDIAVKLFAPLDNKREYEGVLKSFDGESIGLEVTNKKPKRTDLILIPRSQLARANIVYNFAKHFKDN